MLVLPQGADQWNNAERVAAAGAGRALLREQVALDTIGDGIAAILTEPSYRHAATKVQDEIRAMPSPSEAIARFEELIG
jgi:UDP:flavonoid glycosyltransferase YjiC (YdhE family)